MSYAKGTTVSAEKSRGELDKLLTRAGATQRGIGSDDEKGEAWVIFRLADRHVKLSLPLPSITEKRFAFDGNRNARTPEKRRAAWEQACRERWLLVKAKLEAIALGVSTVEREFLADIYLGDGRTVHETIRAELVDIYQSGGGRPLLLGPAGGTRG